MLFALSDEVWLALVSLGTVIFTGVNVWITAYIANQTRKSIDDIECKAIARRSDMHDKLESISDAVVAVEKHTNSMKDALVAATMLTGLLQGAKEERSRSDAAAILAADKIMRAAEAKLQ